jgi:hypothetical protein
MLFGRLEIALQNACCSLLTILVESQPPYTFNFQGRDSLDFVSKDEGAFVPREAFDAWCKEMRMKSPVVQERGESSIIKARERPFRRFCSLHASVPALQSSLLVSPTK